MDKLKPIAPKNFWHQVNKTETCWIWTGKLRPDGYGQVSLYGSVGLPHRVSYELANGYIEAGAHIDHKCHNRACVNPEHLRPVTSKQNGENRSGASRVSKTGVRGVRWVEKRGKWRAQVGHRGHNFHVGYFTDLLDAEAAVIAKRNELFTHNDLDRPAA